MKKSLVQIFIMAHCVAIYSWAYPFPSTFQKRINHFFRPYLQGVGLSQGWNMFAPNPAASNLYVDARIQFKDGTFKIWDAPRVSKASFFEKPYNDRVHKWVIDWLRRDRNSKTWPYLTGYFAQKFWNDKNPPVLISLNRHWSKIPAPTREFYQPIPDEYPATNHFTFYSYRVPDRRLN